MEITASMVKNLREMTGAGMMDSKKALVETDGDIEKAIEYLRKKGLAGAEKKAGRIAAEGVVDVEATADAKKAVVVEVNSETDFVAKNEKFKSYVKNVAKQALNTNAKNIDEFLEEKWDLDNTKTVKEELSSQIAIIGENMHIRRFEQVENKNGFITTYIHGGGRIGVIVSFDCDNINDSIKEMSKNVAMQIAAMRPTFLSREDIDSSYKEHEISIIREEAKNDPKNQGKPENILEKMIEGRFEKQLKEVCLLDQEFVIGENKDKLSVEKYIEKVAKENNANAKLVKYVRYETGEGLEKKNEDFAAEVAKQMG